MTIALNRAWIGLSILSLVTVLAYLDTTLLALLMQPIKRDLVLTDTQLGLLNGLFIALFSAIAAIPIGWAADRHDRRLVLAWCVIAWSLATLTCGAAHAFGQLSVAAVGMAMGESALLPIIYAMIPDIFDERERPTANGLFYTIGVISSGLTFVMGGAIVDAIDGLRKAMPLFSGIETWRLTFALAGILGPFVAALLLIVPKAGHLLIATNVKIPNPAITVFLRNNWFVVLMSFFGLTIYSCAWVTLIIWAPSIIVRSFAVSPAAAGIDLGTIIMAGSLAGVGCSVLATRRWLAGWGAGGALQLVQYGCIAALPAIVVMAFAPNLQIFLAGLAATMASVVFATALAPKILQDVAPATIRSRIIALFPLIALAARTAMSSTVGAISDSMPHNVNGLRYAVCFVMFASLPIAIATLRLIQPAYGRLALGNMHA